MNKRRTYQKIGSRNADDFGMFFWQQYYSTTGYVTTTSDPYNRKVFEHIYDLRTPQEDSPLPPIWTWHIDSGDSRILFDATGKPIESSDAKGANSLSAYDQLFRNKLEWAKDKEGDNFTLRQVIEYGEEAGFPNPQNQNLIGQVYKHYDEAGLITYIVYDFKGNLLEKKREVISDTDILNVFSGPPINWDVKAFVVDWNDAPTLEGSYLSTMFYDAINRVTRMIYPEDIDSERKELIPTYSKSGALEKVKVDGNNYVEHIAYNAQGQRLLVAYANGVMSRYAYYNKRTWLVRMRSEAYSQNGWEFTGTGSAIQDNHHSFDLVGNIVEINEKTPNCGIGGTNSLKREFKYDPLYRLVFGDGRENSPTISPIWDDSYRSTDNLTTTYYKQLYDYDKLGNILKLQHIGNNDFTRNFTYNSINNKLQSIDIGMTSYSFSYDASGNQTGQTSNRNLVWDYRNLLRAFYVQAGTSEPSQYTQYLYGADGVRVKKLVRVQGGNYTSSVYIDDVFEYKTDGTDEQNLLHIMDNQSRIAMIRLGNDFGDTTPAIKYNLEDHLGSSSILLESNGTLINKEEYYPFGETSFGSYAKKRYQYTGKERDEESGLYNYGARYYAPWTCRFISVDPLAGKYPSLNPYIYAFNNPLAFNDPTGMEGEKAGASADNISTDGGDNGNVDGGTDGGDIKKGDTFTDEKGNEHTTSVGEVTVIGNSEVTGISYDYTQTEAVSTSVNTPQPTERDLTPMSAEEKFLNKSAEITQQMPHLGEINESSKLSQFEMWLDSPSESAGAVFGKLALGIPYGFINSPHILITGQSIGGKADFTPHEKFEAFIDVGPGLIAPMFTKTKEVVITTKNALQGYNQFVKAVPNSKVTKGLPDGMKWQTRASKLYQNNKVNQGAVENSDKTLDKIEYIRAIDKERRKKQL